MEVQGTIKVLGETKVFYIAKAYLKFTQGNPKVKSLKIKSLKSK